MSQEYAVFCDACNADLSKTDEPAAYRLTLTADSIPSTADPHGEYDEVEENPGPRATALLQPGLPDRVRPEGDIRVVMGREPCTCNEVRSGTWIMDVDCPTHGESARRTMDSVGVSPEAQRVAADLQREYRALGRRDGFTVVDGGAADPTA